MFSGPIFIYFAMAFIAGFLDAVFFRQFDVYATMSTGNLILGSLAAFDGDSSVAFFAFLMTFCTTFVGGTWSCIVMERFPVKQQSFAILAVCEMLSCLVTAMVLHQTTNYTPKSAYFAAMLIGISNGALCQWVLKMGYTFPLYTINLLKVSESMYKLARNINQGGAKLRGDLLTLVGMLFSFIGGCFAGAAAEDTYGSNAFFFVILVHFVQLLYTFFWWRAGASSVLESFRVTKAPAATPATAAPAASDTKPSTEPTIQPSSSSLSISSGVSAAHSVDSTAASVDGAGRHMSMLMSEMMPSEADAHRKSIAQHRAAKKAAAAAAQASSSGVPQNTVEEDEDEDEDEDEEGAYVKSPFASKV